MESTERTRRRQDTHDMDRSIALTGAGASAVFAVALLLFSAATPGYSNVTNAVSELGIGGTRPALAWNLFGFILPGVLIMIFSLAVFRGLRAVRGAAFPAVLVALTGAGWTGLGVFPADEGFRPTFATTLHFVMVSVNYLPFVLCAFAMPIVLRREQAWRTWVVFSVVAGLTAISSFFIPGHWVGPGASQRIGIGAYFVWLSGTALTLHGRA